MKYIVRIVEMMHIYPYSDSAVVEVEEIIINS